MVPRAGSGGGASARHEPVPVEVALAFHPRTLAQLLYVRTMLRLDDRTDRFLAAAMTGILHGKSASYLSVAHAEHLQHGAALRARLRRTDRLHVARTRRLRWPVPQARPALPRSRSRAPKGSPSWVTRGTWPSGPRSALRAMGRPERARLVVTSPPYLRVVKYGYYNWLRTWFLGFDAREIDATLDDAHHREPYLAFLRDSLAGLRPILTDDAVVVLVIGDVETDRGRGSAAASASRNASGSPPPRPRATRWPASHSMTSPRTAR